MRLVLMIGLAQCDSLSAPVQAVHTTLELVNLAVMIVWIVDPHTGTVYRVDIDFEENGFQK